MDKGSDAYHGSKRHTVRRHKTISDSSNSPIADEGPKRLNTFNEGTAMSPSNNYLIFDQPQSPGLTVNP